MASEVDICNLALSHLRAGSINSLQESSLQAQQCRLHYPFARDQLFEDAAWGFTSTIRPLALTQHQVFGWAHVYQYPSDCLRVNRLVRNWEAVTPNGEVSYRHRDELMPKMSMSPPVEYRIFNVGNDRVIGANESQLRADYNMSVADPTLFSNAFIMALSHLLASNIAVALVGVEQGRQLRSDSLTIYQAYINDAVSNDLNERFSDSPDSEFITVRS